MGGWKTQIRVGDLEADQKLEMTCRSCGATHYLMAGIVAKITGRKFWYLDELEKQSSCRKRDCDGRVHLALARANETSSFVGGLA